MDQNNNENKTNNNASTAALPKNKTFCPEPDFIGDSICDDITNIAECNYDGGDCCRNDSLMLYCHQCTCYEYYNTENQGTITK